VTPWNSYNSVRGLCFVFTEAKYGSGSALLFSSAGVSELLRKVEEVFTRASQGSGEDYLSVLVRTIKGGTEKEALDRLKTVRLALARYFARYTARSVGGITSS
jgi:nuclear pore complex protein Nup85